MKSPTQIEDLQEMLDWAYQKRVDAASGTARDGRRKRLVFIGLPTGEGLQSVMPWHIQHGNDPDTQYSTLRMAIEVYNSI